ncbi:hypothetical protein QTP88_025699 [Uroleucon formosanum]
MGPSTNCIDPKAQNISKAKGDEILQNEFKRFKCTKRGCTTYLRICKNENVVWESSNLNHSHNPDEENKLERQIISNGLKRKAIESICERPSKLLHSVWGCRRWQWSSSPKPERKYDYTSFARSARPRVCHHDASRQKPTRSEPLPLRRTPRALFTCAYCFRASEHRKFRCAQFAEQPDGTAVGPTKTRYNNNNNIIRG